MTELIRRDKNRPCVVMWSVANEPRTQYRDAASYFKQVVQHTRALDPTRPITIAIAQSPSVSFNKYYKCHIFIVSVYLVSKTITLTCSHFEKTLKNHVVY